MKKVIKQKNKIQNTIDEKELVLLRAQIDKIDTQMVELLIKRFSLVTQVAAVKAAHHIPIVVSARINAVKEHVGSLAAEQGLDPEIVKRIYEAIHEESCLIEAAVIKQLT